MERITAVVSVVADCSVIAAWQLPNEPRAAECAELARDWQQGAVEIHVPDLLHSEIGAAYLRAARSGRMSKQDASASVQTLLAMPFVVHSSASLVSRSYNIALQHNQRIYDCFYVSLAEREGMELWTGDERLYNALHIHFPILRFITPTSSRPTNSLPDIEHSRHLHVPAKCIRQLHLPRSLTLRLKQPRTRH